MQIRYHSDRAVLPLLGPLTAHASAMLRGEIEMAVGYYGYRTIELVLESPGGALTALEKLLDLLTSLRAETGVTIRTRAIGDVASAAAFLTALGCPGQRLIAPSARLLLHEPRVAVAADDGRQLTRRDCGELSRLLGEAADRLLAVLARHVASVTAGGHASAVVVREGAIGARSESELRDVLARLLEEERWLSASEALSYGLVDRVAVVDYPAHAEVAAGREAP